MRVFKKTVSLMLVLLLMFSLAASAETVVQDTSFRVFFDGQEINFPDEKPYHNADASNYLYVPLRAISEATGFQVSWEGESKTATITKGAKVATFTVGGSMFVNG